MLKQAFGDSCMSRSRTFDWFGRFKNGRTSTANDDWSGRTGTATTPSKVEQVRAAVNQDHRRTIHDLRAEVGFGYVSCQRILTEQLKMHRIAAKFVPRVLTQDQKEISDLSGTEGNCDKRSHTPLERHQRRWKHRLCLQPRDKTAIFTMEESWVSKNQKSSYAKNKLKKMLICFFDQ